MKKFWLSIAVLFVIIISFQVLALIIDAKEDVALYTKSCMKQTDPERCAIKGSMRTSFFTHDYEVTQKNGGVLIIPSEKIAVMKWTVPQK